MGAVRFWARDMRTATDFWMIISRSFASRSRVSAEVFGFSATCHRTDQSSCLAKYDSIRGSFAVRAIWVTTCPGVAIKGSFLARITAMAWEIHSFALRSSGVSTIVVDVPADVAYANLHMTKDDLRGKYTLYSMDNHDLSKLFMETRAFDLVSN